MAWTAPITLTVGQLMTASYLNTYVAANLTFLASPATALVYFAGAANTNANVYNVFTFNSVVYDSTSGFNTGTGLYTVSVAGIYWTQFFTTVSATAASTFLYAAIGHNAAPVQYGCMQVETGGDTGILSSVSYGLNVCAIGDTLESYIYCSQVCPVYSGLQLNNMSILKVSN